MKYLNFQCQKSRFNPKIKPRKWLILARKFIIISAKISQFYYKNPHWQFMKFFSNLNFWTKIAFWNSVLHSSHSNGIQNMEICRGAVALLFSPPVKLVIADGSLAQKRGKKCNNPIVCKSVEKFSDQVWEEMMHSIISSPRTLKNCENFWWPSNQSYENHIDSVLEKDVKNAHYYKKYKFSNKFSAAEFLKNYFSKSKLKHIHIHVSHILIVMFKKSDS